jgi:hypothetical protein
MIGNGRTWVDEHPHTVRHTAPVRHTFLQARIGLALKASAA